MIAYLNPFFYGKNKMDLIIAGAKVRMDKEGRYSLNDLHRASGGEQRHQPRYWLANEKTKELVEEFAQDLSDSVIPLSVVKGGKDQGTYVCEELVISYAMWISAAFNKRVLQAFKALVHGQLEEAQRIAARQAARLEAPELTEAIKHRREIQGKDLAHYHFSNEFDLVNRVALGKSAKEFRLAHGINKNDPIRDHLTTLEIKCVQALQRANTTMIDMGLDYEKRKTELHKIYVTRHAAGLLAEVKRIEA